LIVSISHDKDVPAVVRELAQHFDRIIVTQYQENPRAVPADKLAEIFRGELAGRTLELLVNRTPREAWQVATQSAVPGECICIAGSFFLAAEMRPYVYYTHAAETSEPLIRL
jgi:dihydrofolate synthase/folylpolyglutamate synthase